MLKEKIIIQSTKKKKENRVRLFYFILTNESLCLFATVECLLTGFFTLIRSKPSDQTSHQRSQQETGTRVHLLEDPKLHNRAKNNEDSINLEERAAHGKLKAHRTEEVRVLLALDLGIGNVALLEFAVEEDRVGLSKHVHDASHDTAEENEVGDGEGDVEEVDGAVDGEDGESGAKEGELSSGDGDALGVDAFEEDEVVFGGALTLLLVGGGICAVGRLGFGHFVYFCYRLVIFFFI